MRALIFVYVREEVVHAQVQNAPLALVKNWARSCVQAAEQDLLVAYPVINNCDTIYFNIDTMYFLFVCYCRSMITQHSQGLP